MNDLHEKIVRFGQPVPINGILTEASTAKENAPCVLIMNSGLMHHVGTCRFSVQLARELAGQGIPSLRFDFPGIGDSVARRGRTYDQESAVEDIRAVMDEMEAQHNMKKFALYGLCSGAYNGYHTAIVDDRVVGIAQIDPYAYRTKDWYWRHYLPRLINISLWPEMIRDKLPWRKNAANDDVINDDSADIQAPSRNEVIAGYQKIISSGKKVLVIMTFGTNPNLNHEDQFYAMFSGVDWQDQLSYFFFPDCSHIITEPEYQVKLLDIISNWVVQLQIALPSPDSAN